MRFGGVFVRGSHKTIGMGKRRKFRDTEKRAAQQQAVPPAAKDDPYWWDSVFDLVALPQPKPGRALCYWVRPVGHKLPGIAVQTAYSRDIVDVMHKTNDAGIEDVARHEGNVEWNDVLKVWVVRRVKALPKVLRGLGRLGVGSDWYKRPDVDFVSPDLDELTAADIRAQLGSRKDAGDAVMSDAKYVEAFLREEPGGRVAALRGVARMKLKVRVILRRNGRLASKCEKLQAECRRLRVQLRRHEKANSDGQKE